MSELKFNSWASPEKAKQFNDLIRAARHDVGAQVRTIEAIANQARDELEENADPKLVLEELLETLHLSFSELDTGFTNFLENLSRGSIQFNITKFSPKQLKDDLQAKAKIFSSNSSRLEISTTKAFQELNNFRSDKAELTRVINNLVTNAFEELSDKGIDGKVLVRFDYDKNLKRIKIDVLNPGTLKDTMVIFKNGFSTKADQREADHPSGTGLYNSKVICEALNGTLAAYNCTIENVPHVQFTASITSAEEQESQTTKPEKKTRRSMLKNFLFLRTTAT